MYILESLKVKSSSAPQGKKGAKFEGRFIFVFWGDLFSIWSVKTIGAGLSGQRNGPGLSGPHSALTAMLRGQEYLNLGFGVKPLTAHSREPKGTLLCAQI